MIVVCGGCGETYETRVRGNTSRHACGHAQYIPKTGDETADASQNLECAGCGHHWETRAKPGNTTRCPECKRARRVPATPPATSAPPPVVTEPRPVAVRPAPEPVRAPPETVRVPEPAAPVPPARARRDPFRLDVTERPAPTAPAGVPWASRIAALLSTLAGGPVRPDAATPDEAHRVFAAVAADGVVSRPGRPVEVDPAAVDRALASIMLARGPAGPGECPIGSCRFPIAVRLVWGPSARADVCADHARRVAAAADRLNRTPPDQIAIP